MERPSVFAAREPLAATKTSQALRNILTQNPTQQTFSVEQILHTLGHEGPGASLLFFSIPEIVPIPGTSGLTGAPMVAIAAQMAAGKKEIRLPKFILDRSVPRRSLAVAIHSLLPVLHRLEAMAKPRWGWTQSAFMQRIVGIIVFLCSLAIACPIVGFNMPHATAVFTTALGLVERDGIVILLGVLIGITSLVCLGRIGVSYRTLRSHLRRWVKQTVKRFSLRWVGKILTNLGLRWIKAKIRWAILLLLWNPEAQQHQPRRKPSPPSPNGHLRAA